MKEGQDNTTTEKEGVVEYSQEEKKKRMNDPHDPMFWKAGVRAEKWLE